MKWRRERNISGRGHSFGVWLGKVTSTVPLVTSAIKGARLHTAQLLAALASQFHRTENINDGIPSEKVKMITTNYCYHLVGVTCRL